MIPLSEPNITGNAWKYVKECLDTNWVGYFGKFIDKLEEEVCHYTGAKYAIACINGTSALHLALKVAGVQPTHEVIVPTLTFVATIAAIRYNDARPVFMDCDEYLNLDVGKVRRFCEEECIKTPAGLKNKKTGRRVSAIVPVHIFGTPCKMSELMEIAKEYDLMAVEDSAEALGSTIDGRQAGTIGDIGIYSFSANKLITSAAGGVIVSDNKDLAEQAMYYATIAKDDPIRYVHNNLGYNYRMSNVHAAIGLSQMEKLDEFIEIKKRNYTLYKEKLNDIKGIELLGYPENTDPNLWFYAIMVKEGYELEREQLMLKLANEGIGIQTRPIWKLNHLQEPYGFYQRYEIQNAYKYWKQGLNIPCSTTLTESQIDTTVSAIRKLGQWR